MSSFALAMLVSLGAGLATGLGGVIAVLKRSPGPVFMASSLGFSAGVMLYVSLVEILGEGRDNLAEAWGEQQGTWAAIAAFFGGIALIAVIDRLVPEPINPHESTKSDPSLSVRRQRMMKTGAMAALAIAIHNFPEGFATFIAAYQDFSLAIPIAIAIAIHNIPEGIAVAVPLREATQSRRTAMVWATLSGLAEPAGALIGYLILAPFIGPSALGLSFAAIAGIMVFISLDELLPTAQATGRHHAAIYGLVAGMAVMAISLALMI
ncbi:Zinc transporter ZupT [Corynebacterium ciconiae DSM 44920]|uniref:zinc transporter ZupT n=1 Tax=Corynebacterium ciconiae TaxID=227319 RepID=UPI0003737066|nr:zinc transporter ZupT [Corynebacterium ciconiae]WKD60842.1 Zinc transporter ZupT [Corynebacterium ciconiae DSM 44920]